MEQSVAPAGNRQGWVPLRLRPVDPSSRKFSSWLPLLAPLILVGENSSPCLEERNESAAPPALLGFLSIHKNHRDKLLAVGLFSQRYRDFPHCIVDIAQELASALSQSFDILPFRLP